MAELAGNRGRLTAESAAVLGLRLHRRVGDPAGHAKGAMAACH